MIFPSPGRPSGPYGNMPYIPGKISLLLLQYAYIMLATTIKVECYHRDSIYLFTVLWYQNQLPLGTSQVQHISVSIWWQRCWVQLSREVLAKDNEFKCFKECCRNQIRHTSKVTSACELPDGDWMTCLSSSPGCDSIRIRMSQAFFHICPFPELLHCRSPM